MAGPFKVKNTGGTKGAGTYRGEWATSSTWAVGDLVVPRVGYATAAAKHFVYVCSTAGTGTGTEPTWVYATPGTSTTTDGTAVFTCQEPTSWANASTRLAYMALKAAAGETIELASDLFENGATAPSLTFAGTPAAPVYIISVDESTGAYEPGAVVVPQGTQTGSVSSHGVSYQTVGGTGNNYLYWADASNETSIVIEDGTMYVACTGTASSIRFGSGHNTTQLRIKLRNVQFRFAATTGFIYTHGAMRFEGCSIHASSAAITNFCTTVSTGSRGTVLEILGCDLSAGAASMTLAVNSNGMIHEALLAGCKLPASWSGTPGGTITTPQSNVTMVNCDSADTNYRYWFSDYTGDVKSEAGLFLDNGAYDGTTRLCDMFATTASVNSTTNALYGPAYVSEWIDTTGTSKTCTVEFIHGGAALLTDGQIWLEVMGQATSGYPLGVWYSDAKADIVASAVAQDTSTATWSATAGAARANSTAYSLGNIIDVQGGLWICTTAGTSAGSEPGGYATGVDGDSVTDSGATFRKMYRQKLVVSITPEEKGTALGRVVIGAASLTGATAVYVDPNMVVT